MRILRSTSSSILSIGLGGALLLISAGPASAADVQCGDVLTSDTVLTADLVCGSTSDGLVVAADGVTLDLAGHTISGPGAYSTPWAGVRVAGRSGVTVTGGTIAGFQAGVVLDQAHADVVEWLHVHGNDQGINLAGGGGHTVEKNTIHDNGRDAVRLGGSSDNRIAKNTLTDNVFGIGVADGSARNLVEKNLVTSSRYFGIALFGGVTQNRVEKNDVHGTTSGHGIQLNPDTTDSLIVKNDVRDNGLDGIHTDSASTTLTKNTAVANGGYGIFAAPGSTDGGGNKASGNGGPAQCVGVSCR